VPGLDGYNDLELSRESRPVPGALLYRFEAPLLFFNAELFKSRVLSLVDATDPKPAYFVLSMESISQLDTTGALAIKEVHAQLQGRGIQFMIARPKLYMSRFGHPDWLGDAFIFRRRPRGGRGDRVAAGRRRSRHPGLSAWPRSSARRY
jgi:MFS superfamily sulfate permease-like transporter